MRGWLGLGDEGEAARWFHVRRMDARIRGWMVDDDDCCCHSGLAIIVGTAHITSHHITATEEPTE